MKSKEFHIPSTWRVKGTVNDAYEILSHPEEFVRWWHTVYLKVNELTPGDDNGVGRTVSLWTKGKLPYTLHWQAQAVEIEKPHRIVVRAQGDLNGRGEWRLSQNGEWVDISYHWTVFVTKPWMIYLSPILKPIFAANHRWAMNQGKAALQQELTNRAAKRK